MNSFGASCLLAQLVMLSTLSLAEGARAQWVEAPGEGWVQVAVYHHDTRETYGTDGSVRTIFADGHAVTTTLVVTGAVGLVRGVDAWLQLPAHRLRYGDAAGDRARTGAGDLRFYVRAGPALAGGGGVPVALRAGVKVPGGDFPVDAEVIPLGEGQRDWELMLELGHSFGRRPVYAMGWGGYRWREANTEADRAPGDEAFAYAALGGHACGFVWKIAAEGWVGGAPRIQGIRVASARRRMLQLLPTVGGRIGPGVLEVGGRFPLAGRNQPAGPAAFVGYFVRWPSR